MEGTRITCSAAMYQETVVSGDRGRSVVHMGGPLTLRSEVRPCKSSVTLVRDVRSQSAQILVLLRHVIGAALLFQTVFLDFDTSQMTNR